MSTTKTRLLLASLMAFTGLTLPPPRPVDPEPLTRPCARCGAAVGIPCDRSTLGRFPYHRVRMESPCPSPS